MALDPKPLMGGGPTENLADWATNGGATVNEPLLGKRQTGWVAEIPDWQRQNWLHWSVWQWLKRLTKAWFFRDADPVSTQKLIASFDEAQNGAQDDGADQNVAGASWVHGSDSMESRVTGPTPSRGVHRIFFDKLLGAFRAGGCGGAQWDVANRATNSTAFGWNSQAVGQDSLAAGAGCVAGDVANVNDPILGVGAVALGSGATASGVCALAVGKNVTASGDEAVAIGLTAVASADGGVAIGDGCIASDLNGVAIGHDCVADSPSSVAMGETCSTSGAQIGSVALGKTSTCSGEGAAAVGWGCAAAGNGSFVSGHLGTDYGYEKRRVMGVGPPAGTALPLQRWEETKGGVVTDAAPTLAIDFLLEVDRAYLIVARYLALRNTGVLATSASRAAMALRVDAAGALTWDMAETWVLEHGNWPLMIAGFPVVTLNPAANDKTIRFAVSQIVAGDIVDCACTIEVVEIGRGV